ncbi:hypothetical protein DL764_001932 [Monosporascus ibericus]|uniref:NAD dependent epimerase/dehydratase n=1 Tax=Monosporascus ibericus TaxID=155417 RepID=A0A4Q4TSC4_9PEZI|nr:hypothetical protein DL764_001932 [Monosporascus ibericus]
MEASKPSPNDNGLKIINASLFRMGTKSMAEAYQILGYQTHHGLLEDALDTPWALIEQAAEATWPSVPGASPRPPNTRAEWQCLWGSYDVVTDLASPFAIELIKVYPDAKVVVVQRDFESWWPSFRSELRDTVMKQPKSAINAFITWRIIGVRPIHAMRKVLLGFFNAKSREEIDAECARKVYDTYFREIRRLVPQERRLEYKLGSGWEPLCKFLGLDIPNVEFPQTNKKSAHMEVVRSRQKQLFSNAMRAAGPWVLVIVSIGAAWFYSQSN